MTGADQPTVAIVGGGFTGAAIAWHHAQLDAPPVRMIIVEPRAVLGGGLAYSADDPAFRINVPAAKMSLDPSSDGDFSRWLVETDAVAGDPDAILPDGRVFPRRSVFGAYVANRVAPLLADGRLEHLRAAATAITRLSPSGFQIAVDDGRHIRADLVVLATTHPPPEPPSVLKRGLADHPRFVVDTTGPAALDCVRRDDHVLVVGTGLTGADVVASLDRRGHRGPITAISRRGLRSKGHAAVVNPRGDFATNPHRSAGELLRAIRAEVSASEAAGLGWHPVLDTVRTQGPAIWAGLSVDERRRLVRHLRPYWDVHRFRVAPQVEAALDRRLAEGSLDLFAASIRAAAIDGEKMVVTLRRRRDDRLLSSAFDAVLVATGPGHGGVLTTHAAAAGLARQGLLRSDPYGLGIDTSRDGRAIGGTGLPVADLLVAGPLARGTFGELMGLPEVANYACFIAEQIASWRPPHRQPCNRAEP